MAWLVHLDVELFRAIHRATFGTPLGAVLAAIQLAGREGMVLLIALATFFAPPRRRVAVAVRLTLTVLLASGACEVLKHAVSEPRPASYTPESLASGFFFAPADGDMVRHARSWPSGHTTAVFAFATAVIALGAPGRAIAGAFLVAILTGLGRVSLGAHFPFDVVAGGCLGFLVAWLLRRPLDLLETRAATVLGSRLELAAPALVVPVTTATLAPSTVAPGGVAPELAAGPPAAP